jgi:hypothetical protein
LAQVSQLCTEVRSLLFERGSLLPDLCVQLIAFALKFTNIEDPEPLHFRTQALQLFRSLVCVLAGTE